VSRAYESAKRAHAGQPLEFTLDGVTFRCSTEISVLDFSELASYADLDSSSPEGIAALQGFFTIMLGQAEYRRFRRHCAQHHTDDDTIVAVMGDLADDFLGRPTKAPSSSPVTPSATGSGSTAPGSHVVVNLGTGKVQQAPPPEDPEPPASTSVPRRPLPAPPGLSALGDVEQVS
jgi:hypothetical protein